MIDATLRGLYPVTPDGLATDALVRKVEAVLAARPALLQYRSKHPDRALREDQARRLAALCRQAGVRFIVNDSPDIALAVGADGVHLGRDDGEVAAARAVLGPGRIIGVSCYDEWDRAQAGAAAGADYLAFGAVFASPTKPAAVRAPLALFRRAREAFDLPLAAIGGITLDNAPEVIAAGADLLAVVTDVFEAADAAARAAAYRSLWQQ